MRVKGYVVEAHVARGGMGDVHRARVETTGELVAIKVMRSVGDGDLEAAARARFEREGRILAELTHPAIVAYVSHGTTVDGRPYLASEWLDGDALDVRLATRRMSAREAATLGATIAGALAAAHEAGIVHRDVKPSNIVLSADGAAKLVDFGIAKAAESTTEAALTRDGVLVGSHGYMAPEQLRGSIDIGPAADVYGLACVLYRALCGGPPGEQDLASERYDVGKDFADLVTCMLHDNPKTRPSAKEVADSLARIATTCADEAPPSSWREAVSRSEQALVAVVAIAAAGPADATNVDIDVLDPASDVSVCGAADASARTFFEEQGARAEVLDHGGCVAVFSGGGWIGEQAAVAARAALGVRNLVPGRPVALTTGRAELTNRSATGDAVKRALAIAGRGETRGVVLDAASSSLLAARFVVSATAGDDLLVEERADADAARLVCGRVVPLCGREAELATLVRLCLDAFEARSYGGARVIGPAGVGKSRLAAEVAARVKRELPQVQVVTTRSDPLASGAPFAMASGIARAMGGAKGAASAHATAPFVTLLAGAKGGGEVEEVRAARGDPALMRDRLRDAFREVMERATQRGPVLLVLDDVQWVDAASMRLVDDVAARGTGPLFVLGLARPSSGSGEAAPDRSSIVLPPLDARSARELALGVIGADASAEAIERIVRLGDGNAFFLEELARATATGGGTPLPESVVALTQSRLAALPSLTRRVLRAASIVRPLVTEDAVAHLLGAGASREDVRAALGDLVAKEVLCDLREGLVGREACFDFRHDLLAEAAYATLTENDARRGHLAAASFADSAANADPRRVAQHLERGGDRGRASIVYARAAELTLRSGDFAGAIACAERAEACGVADEAKGRVLAVRSAVEKWHGDVGRAVALGTSALDLLEPSSAAFAEAAADVAAAAGAAGDEVVLSRIASRLIAGPTTPDAWRIRALAAAALSLVRVGGVADADRVLERAEGMRSALTDDHAIADIGLDAARAARRTYAGDPGAYLAIMPRLIENATRVGDARTACLARAHLGYGHAAVGSWSEAEATLALAQGEAERLALPAAKASVLHNLARVLERKGDVASAASLQQEALAAALEQRNTRLATACRLYLARNALLAAKAAAGVEQAELAHAGARERPLRAWADAILAELFVDLGEVERALAHARAAWAFYESSGGIGEGDATLHLARARALFAAGDGTANGALETARDRLLSRARTIGDETLARRFLGEVEENAATLALCRSRGIDVASPP